MHVGDRVEVKSRFDQRWTRGFQIVEITEDDRQQRFRLMRRSDGATLPAVFSGDELREEKKRETWWL